MNPSTTVRARRSRLAILASTFGSTNVAPGMTGCPCATRYIPDAGTGTASISWSMI